MKITSFEFRAIYYYLTGGKTLKYSEAIQIMKSLGAVKKKDRYYIDLTTAATYFYREFKKVINYRRIQTPIQLYHKALDYIDDYNQGYLPENSY